MILSVHMQFFIEWRDQQQQQQPNISDENIITSSQ